MISTSLINGKKYTIPSVLDDKNNIDAFLARHKDKEVVVVQGLGFVGSVMALVCANSLSKEYAVIGVDLPTSESFWKICSINDGVFPVVASDMKIQEYFENSRKKSNFLATYDAYAYSHADTIIIDINLDVLKYSSTLNDLENYEVDLTPFKKAVEVIGKNCKEDTTILVESTVPPGTTEKIIYPIVSKELKRRGLSDSSLKIGHSYERVMPGPNYIDSIQNFYRVYSGVDKKSEHQVEKFLKTIINTSKYPLTKLSNTNSTEMSKVLENSYRAMNIAFIVEWSRFAEEAGVNLYEVVEAIRMRPTHKNMMLPGIGVGGYCLTKDPLLASWARANLFDSKESLEHSEDAVKVNDKMPFDAFNFLKSSLTSNLSKKRVLLYGVSYAPDVGDTRNSPVEFFYRYLENAGCKISLHDPYISHWNELSLEVSTDIFENLNQDIDLVVFTTGHSEYRDNSNLIRRLKEISKLTIFDTIGIFTDQEVKRLQEKHIIKVLGRGDI